MNETDLTKNPEVKRISKPDFLTIGIGAAGFAAACAIIAYFYREEAELFTDPPPIIIKSGSFVIESDQDLTPPAPHKNKYNRNGFGKIRGIRVITYNEIKKYSDVDDFVEGTDWSASEGVQVNINLQYCQTEQNGVCVSWIDGPQINVLDINNNFELLTPNFKLSSDKGKKHTKRKARREDDEPKPLRFGSVEIIRKSDEAEIKFYEEKDGQEFIIGFYN
jgi:hypothetical protein